MKRCTTTLSILLCLLATGCVRMQRYRFPNPANGQQPQVEDLSSGGQNVSVAYVEYKDDGTRWDEGQIQDAVKMIEASKKNGPALTFLYVHGWKHNASGKTDDVRKFKGALAALAKQTSPYPVNGIYIGWRGRTLNAPGAVSWVTFWDRNGTARRIGAHNSLTNDLNKIYSAAVYNRASEEKNGARSFVAYMGHSFGSRVLEAAADNSAIGKACKSLHEAGEPVGAPIDLTLFLNAASSSQIFRQMNKLCEPKGDAYVRHPLHDKELCEKDPKHRYCQPYSLFTAVSSKTDWATRLVYRIARFGLTPPAHNAALRTHEQVDAKDADPARKTFEFKADGSDWAIQRSGRKPPNHPIWIWQVEKEIMANHGDIWNPDVFAMFFAMLQDSGMIAGAR